MNQYEVMYVIDPALEDGARFELINRFSELVKKNGGEIDRGLLRPDVHQGALRSAP